MQAKITAFLKSNILMVAFVLLGAIAFFSSTKTTPEKTMDTLADVSSADTYIPRGFVLVPIQIANSESLSSLVGDVGGVVDLYLASTERQKGGLKVGSRLKILRAPLNPEQYAVLVKDSESFHILQHAGPFVAVVQNPETQGAELTAKGPTKVRIEYQN